MPIRPLLAIRIRLTVPLVEATEIARSPGMPVAPAAPAIRHSITPVARDPPAAAMLANQLILPTVMPLTASVGLPGVPPRREKDRYPDWAMVSPKNAEVI